MTFGEQINEFISILECTAKDLATASNLTPATLSRYCNGLRVPSADSQEVNNLAKGISSIANKYLESNGSIVMGLIFIPRYKPDKACTIFHIN